MIYDREEEDVQTVYSPGFLGEQSKFPMYKSVRKTEFLQGGCTESCLGDVILPASGFSLNPFFNILLLFYIN